MGENALESAFMPELPEVETVRRSLVPQVVGRTVRSVALHRRDVVHGRATRAALLRGCRIHEILRHGKQLALLGSSRSGARREGCVCVHLGMSGSLRFVQPSGGGSRPLRTAGSSPHTHVVWVLDDASELRFADPRRFGGIWTFSSDRGLYRRRWQLLGADAMTITPSQLLTRLNCSHRPLKAALLDQNVVAGLGNIYVDELLFRSGLNPLIRSSDLDAAQIRDMVRRMRRLLSRATRLGGSTLRDHADSSGRPGRFQAVHCVYGRGGQPCPRCARALCSTRIAGRMTVYCGSCQSLKAAAGPRLCRVSTDSGRRHASITSRR